MNPIASTLGRLAAPPSGQPYDAIRLDLLHQLLTGRALDAGHDAWAVAWDRAVLSLRDTVIADARAGLHAAAHHSKYPARKLAGVEPDPETVETLRHRLLAEGMRLEEFEGQPADSQVDRGRGAALDVAWTGAVRVAIEESLRWRRAAGRIASWRRPMGVFWAAAGIAIAATIIVSGWLGGQVPSPAWFGPIHDAWWSLPWL